MGYESERVAVYGRMKANFTTFAAAQVSYDGQPFEESKQLKTGWCRVTIQNGMSAAITKGTPGTNRVRYVGNITIQIFVGEGLGDKITNTAVDEIISIFQSKQFGGLTTKRAYKDKLLGTSGNFAQTNVIIPFYRDELKG